MVDGINELSGFPLPTIDGRRGRGSRYGRAQEDSRECPGPSSEATLHRPSARRALTASAIALATVTPVIDPIESPADSVNALPPLMPVRVDSPNLAAHYAFQARITGAPRASRSAARRAVSVRPSAQQFRRHPTLLVAARAGNLAVYAAAREVALTSPVVMLPSEPVDTPARHTNRIERTTRAEHTTEVRRTSLARHAVRATRPAVQQRHTYRMVVTSHAMTTRSTRRVAVGGGMSAVIAYARSQVGRRYVTGGTGGSGFDCSGLTQQAYAQAGIALPHSSWAQAAEARGISRGQARAGDLVIGRGHVGIYMGHGMMIDAGNHRVGVVYRKLFSGLRVARL
jgi:cell wall-associated NlpC family hydrolase